VRSLSVIIPVYNVGHYIEKCLRSLENQDLDQEEYEIICVNDGSPDNSRELISGIQKEYSNIVLIDQENQGVSMARNNGIARASGKYLLFIDPDDYVEPLCLKNVIQKADSQQIQVLFLGYSVLSVTGELVRNVFNIEHSGRIFPGIESYFFARGDGKTDPDRMWAVLFNSAFLAKHSLRYLPHVPYLEDGEFIARILCLAKRCAFDGRPFYRRTTRPGSATNSNLFNTEKAVQGFLRAAVNLREFQADPNLSPVQKDFLNQPIAKFVLLSLNSALQRPLNANYIRIRKTLADSGFRKIRTNGVVKPYIYYVYLFNYIPQFFYLKSISAVMKYRIKSALGFRAEVTHQKRK
jgi:glycosyltransferase involved in cell wall biosynthesis